MVEIPLTQGKVALVDDEDAHLAQFKWYARRTGRGWYALRKASRRDPGGEKTLLLHREVLRAPPGVEVDHIDGNGLDCRRANLRLATGAENTHNQRRRLDNTSGHKGVTRRVTRAGTVRWRAAIRSRHIGCFATPEDAARAYDVAARQLFGAFAAVNFPTENERAA